MTTKEITNKDGRVSAYGFACGYVETVENGHKHATIWVGRQIIVAIVIVLVVLVTIAALVADYKMTNQCLADGGNQAVCYGVRG